MKLTENQIKALLHTKISKELRPEISAQLPDNMHIAEYDGVLKYRTGQNPNSLKAFDENRAPGFPKGQSGFGNRQQPRKPLQAAYRKLLESTDKKTKRLNAEHLAKMHLDMLKMAYRRRNLGMFSRLLVDIRSSAGEIPTQEVESRTETIQYTKVIQEFEALPEAVQREYAIRALKVMIEAPVSKPEETNT